jgi:hypothetical protein
LKDNRAKYYPHLIVVIAILTVVLFGHGTLRLTSGERGFATHSLPRKASVEIVQFTAASRLASGDGMTLTEETAQFPEAVEGKNAMVPECSPFYISLLSLPAGWASRLTPAPENIKVSSDMGETNANRERNYINYDHRYKLTVIFFQTPFLILLLLYFFTASARFIPDAGARFWATMGLCFGTLLYPFALTVNPILPAASLLLCAIHHSLSFAESRKPIDGIAAGLYAGSAFAFNHLVYIPIIALLVFFIIRLKEPERLLSFIGGLVPGIAAFVFAHIAVFDDPLPAVYHQSGGETGLLVVWKYFAWSILGYNGAFWMAPVITIALVYLLARKTVSDDNAHVLGKALGIAALVLFMAFSIESVFTYHKVAHPTTGEVVANAYIAERSASPQLEVEFAGFPASVSFQTKVFGGVPFALLGPCLYLFFAGMFLGTGAWRITAMILLRAGIFIGIFAAYSPFGARFFPLIENIHLLGMDLALRFPRESIF